MATSKLVYGVGFTDVPASFKGTVLESYKSWQRMLARCYYPKTQERQPAYKGCSVEEDWFTFSNFKSWFDENFKEGCELDKDLKGDGKVYSAETCSFIPKAFNLALQSRSATGYRKRGNSYQVLATRDGKTVSFGSFKTEKEAAERYLEITEAYLKQLAEEFNIEYPKG